MPVYQTRLVVFLLGLALALPVSLAHADGQVRIDGHSEEAANRSYSRMLEALPQDRRLALQIAIVQLNLEGVSSAFEVASNPALQQPSAGRIRERINGLTANEIIAEAANSDSVPQVEIEKK